MKEQILFKIAELSTYTGIGAIASNIRRSVLNLENHLRVVNYHSIFANEKRRFEDQLRFYRDHYNLLRPHDLLDVYQNMNRKIRGWNLLITFDDGLLSQFEVALNLLEKFNIKGIFFIPTGMLRLTTSDLQEKYAIENLHFGRSNPNDEKCFMREKHLQQLHLLGHSLGSHTVSHCRFSYIEDVSKIEHEMVESSQTIAEITGEQPHFFGYPKGDASAFNPIAIMKSKGLFAISFFALRGFNLSTTPSWCLRRDPIHPHYPMSFVSSCLRGDFDPLYEGRMRMMLRRGGISYE